ncbi:hypothetical protein LPJ59_005914 [Coemansia sp. RSA 2399]|nr:hypothetical protein LPJ59_005914 [Coemansia sp. RSA 2399]KAJ1891060.1 hypothetical protein LPJ81_005813 [Coemansia sp. IMI 209127]
MPYSEKTYRYVHPAPNTETIAAGLGIDPSHYSADFLDTLALIVSQHNTRVVACVERLVPVAPVAYDKSTRSYHYEIRLTIERAGNSPKTSHRPSWKHYAITNSNHTQWRWNCTTIGKRNILPAISGSGSTPFRIYRGALSNVYVRRFTPELIGCMPNLKARFYREIMMRERLARMQLPGVAEYVGCVVEDGLVVGVAVRPLMCSLSDALAHSGGIPCAEIVSTNLVHATIAIQCAGMALRAHVRPSAVMLDWKRCLVLVDIDCLFPEPPGILLADLQAANRKVPSVVRQCPLSPVFACMCSRMLVEPEGFSGRARAQMREISLSCGRRHTCHYNALTSPLLSTRPQLVHSLCVPES